MLLVSFLSSLWQSLECSDLSYKGYQIFTSSPGDGLCSMKTQDMQIILDTQIEQVPRIDHPLQVIVCSSWRKSTILEKQKARCSSLIKCKGKISSNGIVYICFYMAKATSRRINVRRRCANAIDMWQSSRNTYCFKPMLHERMKHIYVDRCFIWQKLESVCIGNWHVMLTRMINWRIFLQSTLSPWNWASLWPLSIQHVHSNLRMSVKN